MEEIIKFKAESEGLNELTDKMKRIKNLVAELNVLLKEIGQQEVIISLKPQ